MHYLRVKNTVIQLNIMSLGNHEFDENVDGLIPFIRNVSTPVLAANLILDKVPELKNENNLRKSIVLFKNHVKIGVIGYLTPETSFLAPKNDVIYEEEISAIKKEVIKLKAQGVKIFIALGHSGFVKDLEIAKQVDDIDLVIGGHSNTFLWNNVNTEKPEYPEGPYPTIIMQVSGRKVPVVQAYAYTKYMGKLQITFDSEGEIIDFDGQPILLSQDMPRDPDVLKIVNKYHDDVDKVYNQEVGSSLVLLNGVGCRLRECNIGNIVVDSMLHYTKNHFYEHYSDVNIAVLQGGRIRSSIDRDKKPFKLTKGDWITVLPFSDTLSIVSMNGTTLLKALEHSVDTWRETDSTGQFLQVSGIKVTYDLGLPPGKRLVDAKAICSECGDALTTVKDRHEYKVLMPVFLADGGDGFTIFEKLPKDILPYNEVTCIIDYTEKYSPISPKLSGRIKLLNEDKVGRIIWYGDRKGRVTKSNTVSIVHTNSKIYLTFIVLTLYDIYMF